MKWSNLLETQFKRILMGLGDNEELALKKVAFVKENAQIENMEWDDLYDYFMELEECSYCGEIEEIDYLVGVQDNLPCRSCRND